LLPSYSQMSLRILRQLIRNSSPYSSLLVPPALVVPAKTFVLHPSLRLQVLEIVSWSHKVLGQRRPFRHPQRLAKSPPQLAERQKARILEQKNAPRMVMTRLTWARVTLGTVRRSIPTSAGPVSVTFSASLYENQLLTFEPGSSRKLV
jgi:hypothetical protein